MFARYQEGKDEDKATELYLWAFSRNTTADELKLVTNHIANAQNKQQAWEDVVWAMLNAK